MFLNIVNTLTSRRKMAQTSAPFSVYIPHIFPNISSKRISDAFETHSLGIVLDIDIVGKRDRNGRAYNSAYVHFDKWFDTENAQRFLEFVQNPEKEARLIYEDPWYWIVLPNTGTKQQQQQQQQVVDPTNNNPLCTLVDAGYAKILEKEISQLRNENARLRMQMSVGVPDDFNFAEVKHPMTMSELN